MSILVSKFFGLNIRSIRLGKAVHILGAVHILDSLDDQLSWLAWNCPGSGPENPLSWEIP